MNYQQKNMLLIIGSLLLAFIAYQFSFSKTLNAASQNKQLQQKLIEAKSANQRIQQLEQQLATLDGNVRTEGYNPEVLFRAISQFCTQNDLKVLTFPQANNLENGNYEMITNEVEISGAYQDIVQLAYLIEQGKKLGRLASLSFKKEKNLRTKTTILKGKLYIQNIISKN